MAPERVEIAQMAQAMDKLMKCLSALDMSPDTFCGGSDSIIVFGKRDDIRLAVQVRYTVGTSPTGRPSAKFVDAKVFDPIGIVENLEANYYYGIGEIKNYGYLKPVAEALGQERSARYNDGAQWRHNIAEFTTSGELNAWLDEWLEALKIDHKKQSAVRKSKPTDIDLLRGATWTG